MSDGKKSTLDSIPIEAITLLFFAIVVGVIGYYFPITFKGPWAAFRYAEISIVHTMPFIDESTKTFLGNVLNTLERKSWASINYDGMRNVDGAMLPITGWIYVAIFMFIVWYKKLRKPTYKKHLDYEGLLDELSKYYRFARCMITLNPLKNVDSIDVTQGDFRIKESPASYLASLGAIKQIKVEGLRKPILFMDKKVAHKGMLKQLGRRHKDWDSYDDYERWLIAAFMCFIASKKFGDDIQNEGEQILGDASYYFNSEMSFKLVKQRADAAIEKYKDNPIVKEIAQSHAFTSGVIRELFHISKTRGIHPAFHFLWLFTVNRTLALLLNETGMPDERGGSVEIGPPESCIECFYPRVHWFNEKVAKRSIMEPMTEYALDDVDEYLIEIYNFKPFSELGEIIETQGDDAIITVKPEQLKDVLKLIS